MRKLARLPSSHYPDYLKGDLSVGLPSMHPLARALDGAWLPLSALTLEEAGRARPDASPAARVRAHLAGLGLDATPLNDDEAQALFAARSRLFTEPGSLDPVRTLAALYLGEAEVRRGRPITAPPIPAGGATTLTLRDAPGAAEPAFVRTAAAVSAERVAAFRRSAATCLPTGVEVLVAPPRRAPVLRRSGFDLRRPVRLEGRRL